MNAMMQSSAGETAYFLNRRLPRIALIGKGVRFPPGEWIRIATGHAQPWQVEELVPHICPAVSGARFSILLTDFDVDEFEAGLARAG
jgi:hypothetical protein